MNSVYINFQIVKDRVIISISIFRLIIKLLYIF